MTSPVVPKDELLNRIAEGWREFRGQVRHLGIAGMQRRTPSGWTYKDLVAHAAAWEEEAARRIRAYRAGARVESLTVEAVDAFNARAVDERRLVGAEAIVEELEAAHRILVSLVRELRDEELADERVQRWIIGNTYGHYAEHREELALAQAPQGSAGIRG